MPTSPPTSTPINNCRTNVDKSSGKSSDWSAGSCLRQEHLKVTDHTCNEGFKIGGLCGIERVCAASESSIKGVFR